MDQSGGTKDLGTKMSAAIVFCLLSIHNLNSIQKEMKPKKIKTTGSGITLDDLNKLLNAFKEIMSKENQKPDTIQTTEGTKMAEKTRKRCNSITKEQREESRQSAAKLTKKKRG